MPIQHKTYTVTVPVGLLDNSASELVALLAMAFDMYTECTLKSDKVAGDKWQKIAENALERIAQRAMALRDTLQQSNGWEFID